MSRPQSAKRPQSGKLRQAGDAVSYEDLLVAQYLKELRKASQNGTRRYVQQHVFNKLSVNGAKHLKLPAASGQEIPENNNLTAKKSDF